MQDEQAVTFQASGIDQHTPWFVNLFFIFLFVAVLVTVVRAAGLMWNLRKHRRTQRHDPSLEPGAQGFWKICRAKVRSIKNSSHLTLLIAVLVLAGSLRDAMINVTTQKTAGSGAIAGAMAEALRVFSAGVVVCTAVFCLAVFLDFLVQRQRYGIDRNRNKPQLPGG
jgi:hypothetical protein